MQIRQASIEDIPSIMQILDDARNFQRSQGFIQWEDGYPDTATIRSDITTSNARVFLSDGKIIAYVYLSVGDNSYDKLKDAWLYDGSYGVIHRLAVSAGIRGQKISSALFSLIEDDYRAKGIGIVRVDTGSDNKIMQHILEKNGYEARGLKSFDWGSRLAFEKRL